MSVFDRLGNLGRGMVRVWASSDERPSRADLLAELDRLEAEARRLTGLPDRPSEDDTSDVADPAAHRRALLDKALEDGILTAEEYARKLDQAPGPSTPTDATPTTPKKRRL